MNRTEKLRAQLSEALEQIPAAFDLLGGRGYGADGVRVSESNLTRESRGAAG